MPLLEAEYLALLRRLLETGERRPTRAGPTRALFHHELVFCPRFLGDVPLLTTRPISFKVAWAELLMFLHGKTDARAALEQPYGVTIWKGNTDATQGDMGPMYGYQWRHYGGPYRTSNDHDEGIDTLMRVVTTLITDPTSRRLVFSSLNMAQADQGVLWPCHGVAIQLFVEGLMTDSEKNQTGRLCLKQMQRSADVYHGLPYNLLSYALLQTVLCRWIHDQTGGRLTLVPGRLITSLGDVHLYENHLDAACTQCERTVDEGTPGARVAWRRTAPLLTIDDLAFEDLVLVEGSYRPCRDPLPAAPFNP